MIVLLYQPKRKILSYKLMFGLKNMTSWLIVVTPLLGDMWAGWWSENPGSALHWSKCWRSHTGICFGLPVSMIAFVPYKKECVFNSFMVSIMLCKTWLCFHFHAQHFSLCLMIRNVLSHSANKGPKILVSSLWSSLDWIVWHDANVSKSNTILCVF